MSGYHAALAAATDAARAAGAVLRAAFCRAGGPGGPPGKCPADAEAERLIRARLLAAFPDFGIRGEELGGEDLAARDDGVHVWLVDPNDGTRAYQRGHRGSAVSIALLRAGRPVLGVVYAFAAPAGGDDLITWGEGCGPVWRNGRRATRTWPARLERGHTVNLSQHADANPAANARAVAPARFRALASPAYRLALAAAGAGDAAVSLGGAQDWDYAAGHALLIGAGGTLLDADGAPVTYSRAGHSTSGGRCFGGGAAVAAVLARVDWAPVLAPAAAHESRRRLVRPEPGAAVCSPGLLERAAGCLLGQFAGDSLGALVEFRAPAAIAAAYPAGVRTLADGGTWGTIAGQPTDDSEMALMLARALVSRRGFDETAVAAAYARWCASQPVDIGSTTHEALAPAAAALGAGLDPAAAARAAANASSQANGALMRVSPLGVFGHAAPPAQLAAWARADARLTHPHPVCQDASALFAVTIAHAVRTGCDGPAAFDFARRWAADAHLHPDVRQTLDEAAERIPADYVSQMGWVRIALQNALHRLLHTRTAEQGIIDTVLCGGDTDTNAAIAGALLGAVHGAGAIPAQWQDRVLTCRPLAGLAGVERPRPTEYWPIDALALAERLLALGRDAAR